MRAVNLLPQAPRRTPGGVKGSRTHVAVAGAVAVLGALGYWGYSVHSEVGQAKDQVVTATVERDTLRTQLGAYQQAQLRVSEQAVRRGAVVGLAEGRINWERIVRDLSAVMPHQVWLTNLKGETDPAATVAAPTTAGTANSLVPRGVHLDGFAYTQDQVALLMARVATVPGLGEPRLATSEIQPRGDREVVHFVIDIPIDQRAQDRPTLTPVVGGQPTAATTGVTP